MQELINKILQVEAHNEQLKVLLTKATDSKLVEKEGKTGKSFDFSQ